MFPGQLELLAHERRRDLERSFGQPQEGPLTAPTASTGRPAHPPTRRTVRQKTGWALVSIGLRIASSASR